MWRRSLRARRIAAAVRMDPAQARLSRARRITFRRAPVRTGVATPRPSVVPGSMRSVRRGVVTDYPLYAPVHESRSLMKYNDNVATSTSSATGVAYTINLPVGRGTGLSELDGNRLFMDRLLIRDTFHLLAGTTTNAHVRAVVVYDRSPTGLATPPPVTDVFVSDDANTFPRGDRRDRFEMIFSWNRIIIGNPLPATSNWVSNSDIDLTVAIPLAGRLAVWTDSGAAPTSATCVRGLLYIYYLAYPNASNQYGFTHNTRCIWSDAA